MNSWAESACYPQSTFYPLSDGPSIQNHRITMTCFRTCSTCRSRSQAFFAIALSARCPTVPRRPSYSSVTFGRRPPQSNCLPCTVPDPDNGPRLEPQRHQGGISRTAPSELASRVFKASHLSYTSPVKVQCKATVKVHGVFPSSRGRLHLHKHFNFAESQEETVWPSLRHSCRSELTRQGISLP